jgi:hypothetical protein
MASLAIGVLLFLSFLVAKDDAAGGQPTPASRFFRGEGARCANEESVTDPLLSALLA